VPGHEFVEGEGGQVFLIDLVPGFSTTNIVSKIGRPQVGGKRA
jgi:bifunctional ADP-heptose synthase (sugar kinase/adenylyltransferase)